MKKSAKVWQFVQEKSGSRETWTWRRTNEGGVLEEVSPPHDDFGKAVADALAHGFQPRRQLWETRAGIWVTQFPPGKAPISTRDAVPLPPPATSGQKKAARNRIRPASLKLRREKPLSPGGKPPPAKKTYCRQPE